MNNGINRIQTEADVERSWIVALLNEQIDDPMHTTPSKNDLVNYDNDGDVIMAVAKRKKKGLDRWGSLLHFRERQTSKSQTWKGEHCCPHGPALK